MLVTFERTVRHMLPGAKRELVQTYIGGSVIKPGSVHFHALRGRELINRGGVVTDFGKQVAQWLIRNDQMIHSLSVLPNSPFKFPQV